MSKVGRKIILFVFLIYGGSVSAEILTPVRQSLHCARGTDSPLDILLEDTGDFKQSQREGRSVETPVAKIQVNQEAPIMGVFVEMRGIEAIPSFPAAIYDELGLAEWHLKRLKTYLVPSEQGEEPELYLTLIYKDRTSDLPFMRNRTLSSEDQALIYAGAFGMYKGEAVICR